MAEKKKLGFETPISELPENVSIKSINEDETKQVKDYFVKVPCVFKKVVRKGVVYGYTLDVNLHPLVNLTFDNKKVINETEFALMIMQLNLPVDIEEIKFNGYIRFLKGESDKTKSEDHSFLICELYMGPELNTVSTFVSNATKKLMDMLSRKTEEELKKMKADSLISIPLYKLGSTESKEVLEDLDVAIENA